MLFDFEYFNINNLKSQSKFEESIIRFIEDWHSESKKVEVQTSGSTGTPKIFEIEKQKMLNSAKMTCDFLDLKKGNTALICLPVEYISGKMMVVRSIERKLKLIIKKPSAKPLEDLNKEIDFCAMSPLQVENSLNKIHFIKNLIIGGAQVSEKLKNKIKAKLSTKNQEPRTKVFETYGMSETLSHIALKEIFPVSEAYFKVLNDIQISLDERGCLKIFAPKLNPDILQTNDLVELKNAMEFKFLGRIDHVINSGGLKISPEPLENLMKENIPNELIFFGKKDEILGHKLVLIIEGKENEVLNSQILLSLKEIEAKFSKNHQPKEIIFLNKFTRSENGKILRNEILKLF